MNNYVTHLIVDKFIPLVTYLNLYYNNSITKESLKFIPHIKEIKVKNWNYH